ncbi:hypothetical protein HALLA_12195 [Halostagnicola larsenii XH-48]|uniref:Uncharacterized protein n=1 Tax=Halostagnicola larsenii XH-48 TaxID=797299 RepID=W0JVB1_9EURY|nr:hypothetical protein HALLA_11885 [Halostagnicola larsenii XH-48]AHG00983.1 hypothetical protein HALLA_12195 [Halostagnicola larsenii XH-48]
MSIQTQTHESVSEIASETETSDLQLSAVAGEHTSMTDELPDFDVFHAARQFATDALETAVAEEI